MRWRARSSAHRPQRRLEITRPSSESPSLDSKHTDRSERPVRHTQIENCLTVEDERTRRVVAEVFDRARIESSEQIGVRTECLSFDGRLPE